MIWVCPANVRGVAFCTLFRRLRRDRRMAKAPTWLESIAVILYCVFLYRQIVDDTSADDTYARFLSVSAKTCQGIAGTIGALGVKCELEYNRVREIGRMN